MNLPTLVQIRDVSKSYTGVHALTGVGMDIARGEVHALCGENGAGKSTLIKILTGSVTPDAGKIVVNDSLLTLGSVRASEAAGIAVIHQESVAFPHLSTFDNIFVGRELKKLGGLFLDRAGMRAETRNLLGRLGEADAFDPARPVGELSVAQRQMVGMARALSQDCRLLIMDEPTASLSERETRVLFNLIRQFRTAGVSILYVSHRLDEVFALADRVTVVRDGKHVATEAVGDLTREKLIRQMVGRELLAVDTSEQPAHAVGSVVLQVKQLARAGVFHDISFALRAGEIVGMAGLVGAGRSEVARVIFGADHCDSGQILLHGAPFSCSSIRDAMNHGIAMVPEDRQHLGLVLPLSVGTNLTLPILRSLTRLGLTSSRKERDVIKRLIHQLAVKAASPKVAAQTLSGGNQQKLVIGKWLATNPRVLILDEPTRGVDVGAKAEVHKLIRQLASQGMATLLISSDLPEVLAMSDRILVMRAGAIAGELSREQGSQEAVLSLALGAGKEAAA
jgi:rhamnose transport system ATP-binding protein